MCVLSTFCNVDIKDEAIFDRRKFFILVNFLQVFKTLEGDEYRFWKEFDKETSVSDFY